jgi:hypothetical protein
MRLLARAAAIAALALLTLGIAWPGHAANAAPSFTIVNASADENAGQLCFAVKKHGTLNPQPSTVRFYTLAGTAKAGADYTAQDVKLQYAAAETLKSVCVPLTNDAAAEPTETMTGKLQALSNARIYDGTAVGTITDGDPATPVPPPPPPAARIITCQDVSVSEGAGVATVSCSLSGSNGLPSKIQLVTIGGMPSAIAGIDYGFVNSIVTVPADAAGVTFDIPIIDDATLEAAETFGTTIVALANVSVAHDAQVTIIDNDAPPPAPAEGVYIARSLSPLDTLQYVRTTRACLAFRNGEWVTAAAGLVFKTIPGDWAWHADNLTDAVKPGITVQRGWPVDASGAVAADAPFVELDRACVEGVTPAT